MGGPTGSRAAQESLFLLSLEQGGSDKLLGDQGITASPVSSLDLLVLAIRMACNFLRVECGDGCLRRSHQTWELMRSGVLTMLAIVLG